MLKNLPPLGKKNLVSKINNEWTAGKLPAEWKKSLVVPIPKASGVASGYLPIALTSCLPKLMERMVSWRLMEHLETHNLLDNRQHVFRPGFGTMTYFFAAIKDILAGALDREEVVEMIWT